MSNQINNPLNNYYHLINLNKTDLNNKLLMTKVLLANKHKIDSIQISEKCDGFETIIND